MLVVLGGGACWEGSTEKGVRVDRKKKKERSVIPLFTEGVIGVVGDAAVGD